MNASSLRSRLQQYAQVFHPVVPFDPGRDRLYPFDFTRSNTDLTAEVIADTESFAHYIKEKLMKNNCLYGIGGYNEHRTLYARSTHFNAAVKNRGPALQEKTGLREEPSEPRRLHLGTDIWGPAGTKIMSAWDGIVHSFAFNNNNSDYGATIILTHNLQGTSFHILFGHLSLNSLKNLEPGKRIKKGEVFSEFGMRFENGNWPPHLHVQLISDMMGYEGDYPGVCVYADRESWLDNSPDPDFILQLKRFIQD